MRSDYFSNVNMVMLQGPPPSLEALIPSLFRDPFLIPDAWRDRGSLSIGREWQECEEERRLFLPWGELLLPTYWNTARWLAISMYFSISSYEVSC